MSGNIEEEHHAIETDIGVLNCYVQGKITSAGFVILTVHDLGCNHTMWHNFINHSSMVEITKRTAYIHIDLPGQEDSAQPLPANYKFPTMQQIAEALPKVLDELKIKTVVCLGEGAGANVLARFACSHASRTLGLVLLHCTGTTAGFMESIKDKIIGWKLDHIGINPAAEHYLVLHRFGLQFSLWWKYTCRQSRKTAFTKQKSMDGVESAGNKEQLEQLITEFKTKLATQINPHNLKLFVDSFMSRSNIANQLHNINCDVLMVSGALASHAHTVSSLYKALCDRMDFKKHKAELVLAPGVANVLDESPSKLAETLQYYLQGLGLLGSVPMRHVTSIQRVRTISMEEADLPKSARSGFPSRQRNLPPSHKLFNKKQRATGVQSVIYAIDEYEVVNHTHAKSEELHSSLAGSPPQASPLSTSPPKEQMGSSPQKESPLSTNTTGAEGDVLIN